MIRTYYEFGCDYCNQGIYPDRRSKKDAIKDFRKEGGIVCANGLTFCSKECHQKFKEAQ